ncbi:MAG: aminoacyl-tRNA hydrolase [Proteobacteria bacterium]|nr:aminoacyl-tRNA hydrolase [Pseudomonadota bacterium]
MWLLVGLGNPGPGYAANRHNIGFMAVDRIVGRHGFAAWRRVTFNGLASDGVLGPERVIAFKPTTFMNESGSAVGALMRWLKLEPDHVIVIHDDLDLAPGKLRTKRGGGNGGHNGLRSLDADIGPDYRRVRLGIGHPGDKGLVLGHVLSDFTADERAWLEPLLETISEAAALLVSADEHAFANKVAVLTAPPPKPAPPDAVPDSAPPGAGHA